MTTRLETALGDITTQEVDAVVNAANSSLLGGGGVDGAIHRAAGPDLLAECREVRAARYPRGLPVGQAVATGAGRMSARWVIHTVGPDARKGQDDSELLASCFSRSLDEAVEVGARSVAFPAVSAGVFGWPVDTVAEVAAGTVRGWVADHPDVLDLVRFVLFSPDAKDAFDVALSH